MDSEIQYNEQSQLSRWRAPLNTVDPIIYLCAIQADPVLIPRSNRVTLARLFCQLGYKTGAEIGVGSGPYSEAICQHNPGVQLYCIDAWQPYPDYRDFTNAEHLESDYAQAQIRLGPYRAKLIRSMSMDAAKEFYDGSLDFIYIDANHDSPYIDQDIACWSPKVRSGGIVSGHDYVGIHPDVIRAVDNYVAVHNIHPFYLVGKPEETSNPDTICSWFFIQP